MAFEILARQDFEDAALARRAEGWEGLKRSKICDFDVAPCKKGGGIGGTETFGVIGLNKNPVLARRAEGWEGLKREDSQEYADIKSTCKKGGGMRGAETRVADFG